VTRSDFVIALARVARSLPSDQLERAASVLGRLRGPGSALDVLCDVVPTEPFRAAMAQLVTAWKNVPDVDGEAVALALLSASVGYRTARADSQVEVVWTGPEGEVEVRLTYSVLIEVIRSVQRRLTLVSFAAHRVKEVTDALRVAADGGAEIRLVLDGGTEAARAFDVAPGIAVYTWPPTLLPEHDPHHASLHAKAAIADDQLAFVTSANLTGYALDRNMELGLLVRGGDVPRLLAAHFDGLIGRGILLPVAR
jgi:phosphatidylserine/phosphatidylglycerophosphate/cardiolipin synthase-like enzyme